MLCIISLLFGVLSVVQSYPIGRNDMHSARFKDGDLNVSYDIAMKGGERGSAELSKSGLILENLSNVLADALLKKSKRALPDDFFAHHGLRAKEDDAYPSDLIDDHTLAVFTPDTDYEVMTFNEVMQIREDAEGHIVGKEHKERRSVAESNPLSWMLSKFH